MNEGKYYWDPRVLAGCADGVYATSLQPATKNKSISTNKQTNKQTKNN